MIYKGKPTEDFTDTELATTANEFDAAIEKRKKASFHKKFNKELDPNAMEFPPINPEFLKLKIAIDQEVEKRKNKNGHS